MSEQHRGQLAAVLASEGAFVAEHLEHAQHDFAHFIVVVVLILVSLGNFEAAMDGMLDVLRQDKHYRNDEVRKVLLGMFEMLGDESPLTRQYRSELASVLF